MHVALVVAQGQGGALSAGNEMVLTSPSVSTFANISACQKAKTKSGRSGVMSTATQRE